MEEGRAPLQGRPCWEAEGLTRARKGSPGHRSRHAQPCPPRRSLLPSPGLSVTAQQRGQASPRAALLSTVPSHKPSPRGPSRGRTAKPGSPTVTDSPHGPPEGQMGCCCECKCSRRLCAGEVQAPGTQSWRDPRRSAETIREAPGVRKGGRPRWEDDEGGPGPRAGAPSVSSRQVSARGWLGRPLPAGWWASLHSGRTSCWSAIPGPPAAPPRPCGHHRPCAPWRLEALPPRTPEAPHLLAPQRCGQEGARPARMQGRSPS